MCSVFHYFVYLFHLIKFVCLFSFFCCYRISYSLSQPAELIWLKIAISNTGSPCVASTSVALLLREVSSSAASLFISATSASFCPVRYRPGMLWLWSAVLFELVSDKMNHRRDIDRPINITHAWLEWQHKRQRPRLRQQLLSIIAKYLQLDLYIAACFPR